jgi:hypothetical protein
MMPRLICLVRTHQWRSAWDSEQHKTVWTCNRCGKTRVRLVRTLAIGTVGLSDRMR